MFAAVLTFVCLFLRHPHPPHGHQAERALPVCRMCVKCLHWWPHLSLITPLKQGLLISTPPPHFIDREAETQRVSNLSKVVRPESCKAWTRVASRLLHLHLFPPQTFLSGLGPQLRIFLASHHVGWSISPCCVSGVSCFSLHSSLAGGIGKMVWHLGWRGAWATAPVALLLHPNGSGQSGLIPSCVETGVGVWSCPF